MKIKLTLFLVALLQIHNTRADLFSWISSKINYAASKALPKVQKKNPSSDLSDHTVRANLVNNGL